MKRYRVTVEADFEIQAKDPESVRKGLVKVLKQEGFRDKSFEISVERVEKAKGVTQ